VAKGDEATSRHAIRQMQTLQQRLGMLQAELAEHRISTGALISRVNELEAVVAEARRKQQGDAPSHEPDSLRERLSKIRGTAATTPVPPAAETPKVVNEQEVEADLARRRARLSQ
jgi:phage shock protein A